MEGLAQTVHVDPWDAGRRRGFLLEVEGSLQFPPQPLHAVHVGKSRAAGVWVTATIMTGHPTVLAELLPQLVELMGEAASSISSAICERRRHKHN